MPTIDISLADLRALTKSKLTVDPVQEDGIWRLQLAYDGDEPKGVPEVWNGHRVVLKRVETPPPSA